MTSMDSVDGLEGLRGLHRDLLALGESRLPNVERLCLELEERLGDFRKLLSKDSKRNSSRQSVLSGKIQLDGEEYSVNEDFQQGTLQLAEALNLDELQAARIFMNANEDAEDLDRPVLESAIIRFHERRQFLLECLRLVLRYVHALDPLDDLRGTFLEVVRLVVNGDNPGSKQDHFVRKCLSHMTEITQWLQNLAEKAQSASILGQTQQPELVEIMEFQQSSLLRQHESLGAIVTHLIKGGWGSVEDLHQITSILKRIDKYDIVLVHYIPATVASISHFGSPEGSGTLRDARSLHDKIVGTKDQDSYTLHFVQAAVRSWWLSEYSGWYLDYTAGSSSPLEGVNVVEESEGRSKAFLDALKDGAFQFMLSLCADLRPTYWHDPARQGLRDFLLRETPTLSQDTAKPSDWFTLLLMEEFESIVDAFITNMPDTLRKLRTEEDQQRKQIQGSLQRGLQRGVIEHDLHLERFLVIIAYVFENRPDASESFWSDPDSNLFGFLQWASKRQSTPRVAAFCEMLQALSEGQECADSAHRFLLEEGPVSSGKLRRTGSISWSQVFSELQFYASKIRDRPALPQTTVYPVGKPRPDDIDEPESAMMLECYLRLTAHMCRESSAARTWILNHPTFHLVEILFLLCGSAIPSRLRACAFNTLRALLTAKTREIGDGVWSVLDQWISGGVAHTSNLTKSAGATHVPFWTEKAILRNIASGFEEPNAFVGLLHSLLSPSSEDEGLNDALPFPESLGSGYRMPGIEPYLDFALGEIFADKCIELQDTVHVRLLRLSCLDLIARCLSTFNEDLVIFANRSNISIESAMKTSSLLSYVRLHPFSRTMEWLFNDKALRALFAAAHQDVAEIAAAGSDAPLVLGLLRSMEVMNLIMDLQATYIDIVRPLLNQPPNRRTSVADPALVSFEDSVLKNLQLVVDVGLYCGTGHQELVIASLKLFGKLASSRKLNTPGRTIFSAKVDRNKVIGVLEMNGETHRIARSLAAELESDVRDLEEGPDSPSFVIKTSIIEFLTNSLAMFPDRPNVAHLMLGFSCVGTSLDIADDSAFTKGLALFHSVMRVLVQYPDGEDDNFLAWLMRLKQGCWQVMRELWRSSITSTYAMTELRTFDFFVAQCVRQPLISPQTFWEGRQLQDKDFLISASALCFADFLRQRASLYEYMATELRIISREGSPSVKTQLLSTIFGSTSGLAPEPVKNASMFDLFDFMELDLGNDISPPDLKYFADLDFTICLADDDLGVPIYNLPSVQELITLHHNELRQITPSIASLEEENVRAEAQAVLIYLQADNERRRLLICRLDALRAWTQLVIVVLQSFGLDHSSKLNLILQTLQVILPKLEKQTLENEVEAIEFVRLAQAMIFELDFSASFEGGKATDLAYDRLFQLFKACLRGIQSPVATTELRELLYNICYRYITGMSDVLKAGGPLQRHSIKTIKAAGERLIEVICDDAYSGENTCRISALLLIDALAALANRENSRYIVESLIRLNFIGILIDSIKVMPMELSQTRAADIPSLLSSYDARLFLLLRLSQTKSGANHIINVGLFGAIRESHLFSVDPDLGIEMDNPQALKRYYELLLAITRVISPLVLTAGPQNEGVLEATRSFLQDHRHSVVGLFKRQARIGVSQTEGNEDLDELVENLVLLLTVSNFLDFEEDVHFSASKSFS